MSDLSTQGAEVRGAELRGVEVHPRNWLVPVILLSLRDWNLEVPCDTKEV